MLTKIKDDYAIDFSDSYLQSDTLTVIGFSDIDYKDKRICRKWMGQVSSRAYYPSGRKKWFFKMMFFYHFRIPKVALTLNPEKSGWSYVYYDIDDMELINSTSGGSGDGVWTDFQNAEIHHCKPLRLKDFKTLAAYSIPNADTIEGALDAFALDFDPVSILFIEKYANGKTNYNKATKNYSSYYQHNLHPLVIDILRGSCYLSKEDFENWRKRIINGNADKKAMEILFDYLNMADAYRGKQWHSIPSNIYEAFKRIRRYETC